MSTRTKTLGLAVGGIVALGGVTLFSWKRGHAPPPPAPIRADTPVIDAAAPTDAGQRDAAPDAAKPATVPEEPLSPECAALQRINDQTIRKFEERKNHCVVDRPEIGCATTDNGVTWGYRIAKIEGKPSKPPDPAEPSDNKPHCESTSYDLELVRRDRKGMKAVSSGNETLSYDFYYTKQNALTLKATTDYDGDGEVEIFRSHYEYAKEVAEEYAATLLTFKNGDVTPYPPAKGLILRGFEDIDGDGRLDVLTSAPYEEIRSVSPFGNASDLVSTWFAYHSLSDGTFTLNDDAVVAYTRSRCPSPPKAVSLTLENTTPGGSGDLADQLVCARLWGESREKIEGAWNTVCKDFDGGDNSYACQDWALDLAKIAPPFQLR